MVPAVTEFLLRGAWTKLARSEHHLQSLTTEMRAFLKAEPYGFLTRLDYENSRYLFYVERVEEPPLQWSAMIGDFIHNLRSALDHLTWQLALKHYGGTIPPKVWPEISYPIADDLDGFKKRSALRHLNPKHITFMERFQTKDRNPYNPLTLLNDLWNTDKHRTIHSTLITAGDVAPEFTPNDDARILDSWYAKGKQLEVGTKFACVTFEQLGPDPKVTMDSLRVNIAFGDCPDIAINALRDVTRDILNGATEEFFGT
jgi:hypothetical protein